MSETVTGTPNLNKALAAVQAELPKISKDQEGKVSGEKDGRRYSYSYRYADLAGLSEAVLPLLGKHGLAFTALPGMSPEGKFGLTYLLLHQSGEEKGGFYPITPGTPQQNGSAITYARRYCLGAVTGVAPAEDDDGAAASHAPQSAGDAWDSARPAPSRGQRNEPQRPAEDPWETATPAPKNGQHAEDDPALIAWASKIDEITDRVSAMAVRDELMAAGLDSAREQAISQAIDAKLAAVSGGSGNGQPQRPSRPRGPSAEERGAKPVPTGSGDDGEWVKHFEERLAVAMEDDLAGLQKQVGNAVGAKKISPAKSADLTKAIQAKRRELQGAAV